MKAPHTVSDADDGASAAERAAFVDSLTDLSSADTPIAAGLPSHPLRSPTLAWQEVGDDESSLLNLDFALEPPQYESAFIQDRNERLESPVQMVNMKMLEGTAPAPAPAPVPAPAPASAQALAPVPEAASEPTMSPDPAPSTPDDIDEDHAPPLPPTTAVLPMHRLSELERRAHFTDAADELRPSMEEYKKLSSKEKRQLRNKISARNFRNRRKEYITLLEEQVADRDSVIDGLREQISTLSLQNKQLRDEVRALHTRTLGSVDVNKFIDALRAQDGSANPHSPRLWKETSAAPQHTSPFWSSAPLPSKTATLAA